MIKIDEEKILADKTVYWENIADIKVDSEGNLTKSDGSVLSVDLLNGKSLEEYLKEVDAITLNGKKPEEFDAGRCQKVRLLPGGNPGYPNLDMFGYRSLIYVDENEEINYIGYNDGSVLPGVDTDVPGIYTIPYPREKHIAGIKIKQIYAITMAFYFLFEDGDLYHYGNNTYGQAGQGHTTNPIIIPVKVMSNVKSLWTATSGHHQSHNTFFAITTDNKVYGWGYVVNGVLGDGDTSTRIVKTPIHLSWLDDIAADIIKIEVTDTYHASCHILTSDGRVFAAGYNGYGNLGTGDTLSLSRFTEISMFDSIGERIKDVIGIGGYRSGDSAYYYKSTHFLTESGRVFACGYNPWQNLGIAFNASQQNKPTEITYYWDWTKDPTVGIYTYGGGGGTVYFRTRNGDLYGAGANGYGELASRNGRRDNQTTETFKIQFITNNVKEVYPISGSMYSYHKNVIIKKYDNTLWGFGYNGDGNLGVGGTSNQFKVTKVPFEEIDKIKQIYRTGYSSEHNTYILLDDGRLFGWGDTDYQQLGLHMSSDSRQSIPQRVWLG